MARRRGGVAKAPLLEHPSGRPADHARIDRVAVRESRPPPSRRSSRHLSFIVIDELHSFIGTERGAHLRSLICRFGAKSREAVRRAGLSATFGDDKAAVCRWLRPGEPDEREDHRINHRSPADPVEDLTVISSFRPWRCRGGHRDRMRHSARSGSRTRRVRRVLRQDRPHLHQHKVLHRTDRRFRPARSPSAAACPTCSACTTARSPRASARKPKKP